MTEEKKNTVFSREAVAAKQQLAKEEYEKKVREARQMFEAVASTPQGEKLMRYLFLLCGGDSPTVRRDKEREVSINETLLVLGTKSVWENIRFYLNSDTIKKIERHDWEDQK